MTEQQLKDYKMLTQVFYRRCKKICNILSNLDSDFKNMTQFKLKDKWVICRRKLKNGGYLQTRFYVEFLTLPDHIIEHNHLSM